MHILESFTLILILTTVLSYLNERYLKLSPTIGATVLSLLFSSLLLLLHQFIPSLGNQLHVLMEGIRFDRVLLNVMLGSLLFAGAFNLKINTLWRVKYQVISSALLGTILSTLFFALLFHGVSILLGLGIPFIYSLLFGTLISPTDPIATLAILKENKIEESLEYKIAGESLFNDAMGVVLFGAVLGLIINGSDSFSMGSLLRTFLWEAAGGVLLGVITGFMVSLLIRRISSSPLVLLLSLTLVFGLSLFSEFISVSQPLAVISSGLVLSGRRSYLGTVRVTILESFWEDLEGMLNLILFILIGLESILIFEHFTALLLLSGLLGIVVTLISRSLSVFTLLLPERRDKEEFRGLFIVLSWGALRGGLAIALALSVPPSPPRKTIILVTYIIVLFSVIIQGLSIGKLSSKFLKDSKT